MKLALFFHARLSGGDFPEHPTAKVNPEWGATLFDSLMNEIQGGGLYENLNKFVIGLNGTPEESLTMRSPIGAEIAVFGPLSSSLLPTMALMQKWLPGHEDWLVCFAHMKGATHPHDSLTGRWRHCMAYHCLHRWHDCVSDLQSGKYDACGVHWTHNNPNDPNADRWGGNSYFAGVFWWATARYLLTLPKLPEQPTDRHSFYLPELWLGNGKPRVRDYHAGPATIHQ